jgi:hypothetical protein
MLTPLGQVWIGTVGSKSVGANSISMNGPPTLEDGGGINTSPGPFMSGGGYLNVNDPFNPYGTGTVTVGPITAADTSTSATKPQANGASGAQATQDGTTTDAPPANNLCGCLSSTAIASGATSPSSASILNTGGGVLAPGVPLGPWGPALPILGDLASWIASVAPVVGGLGLLLWPSTIAPDNDTQSVYHYTTATNAALIQAGGFILGNPVYTTPQRYADGSTAQSALALSQTPDGYFKIPAANAVPFVGMGTVAPYNSQPGGGFELMTGHPIPTAGAIWVPF